MRPFERTSLHTRRPCSGGFQRLACQSSLGRVVWYSRALLELFAQTCLDFPVFDSSGIFPPAVLQRMRRLFALQSPCHGQTAEGQITRLKMVKRQMYGRGKIDFLQARLVGTELPRAPICCTKISSEPNLEAD